MHCGVLYCTCPGLYTVTPNTSDAGTQLTADGIQVSDSVEQKWIVCHFTCTSLLTCHSINQD